MNDIINNFITGLNNIGSVFCDYAVNMLIQSSVLIVLLLIVDFFFRKRVRAVFRYCIWMLVFVKLILPASFTLPTGLGYWLSDYWPKEKIVSAIKQHPAITQVVPATVPAPVQSEVTLPEVTAPVELPPVANETIPNQFRAVPISSQAIIFIVWFVGVLVLSALLIQRVFFVRALVAQSKPAKGRLLETLQQCRSQMGVRKKVQLRLSENALSPAVCGLFKPIILMPTGLLEKLSREKLRAVLVHELAHIKRADIWVNLVQTVLQIVYFYNPFVWLANMMVRRVREQAVDEMVLVSLKQGAETYSNTLIDIGQMAFLRPNLSLRLVGVVESKKALQRRIKHMLSRPIPKNAKLGIAGLLTVILIGCTVLPMARADKQKTLSKSKESKFIATLPNGVTVELVGTCQYTEKGVNCYKPDGLPLGRKLSIAKWNQKPKAGDIGFMFKVDGSEDVSLWYHGIEGAKSTEGSCEVLDEDGKKLQRWEALLTRLDDSRMTTTAKFGAAAGVWKTVAEHDGRSMGIDNGISFTKAVEVERAVQIYTTDTLGRSVTQRIVAIDNTGKLHPWKGHTGSVSNSQMRQSIGTFPNLKLDRIEKFQFQTRPYQWATFKNVSLKPNFKTDVQIEIKEGKDSKISDADKMASEDLASEGWRLYHQQKLIEAEESFEVAVEKDDSNANAWNGLGWSQLNQGKRFNAKKSFEKCIEIEPKHAAPLNGLGWIAYGEGNSDEAIEWWEKAVDVSNGYATASLSGLTQVYMQNKDYDKAAKYYKIWLSVKPDSQQAKSGLEEAKSKQPTEHVEFEKPQKPAGQVDITPSDFDIHLDSKQGLCHLVVSVNNQSKIDIPRFKLRFYRGIPENNLDVRGNVQSGWNNAGPIKPGESWNERSRNLNLPDGQYLFSVALDYDDNVPESDESNNQATINVKMKNGQIVDKLADTKTQSANEKTVSAIEKISFAGNDIIQVKANAKAGFNFPFYLFVPKSIDKNKKAYLLVEANNTGKTSDELEIHQEKAFRLVSKNYPNRIARSLGSPLLVPVFPRPKTNWQAYTHALDRDTLEIEDGKLKRIDLQLTAMIKYAQQFLRINGFKIHDKVFMHGFSASAKFCNRYSFLHPEMVKAVASGGVNGLPTLPVSKWNDYELPFPIGISGIERFTDKTFDEKAFRKVAHYIYMGAFDRNDTLPSRDAWSGEEADIIKKALAEKMMPDRWELSQKIYKEQNINAQCVTYNGISHSIKDEMLDDVIKFFKANSGNKYVPIEPYEYPYVEYKQIKHAHINGLYWPDDERIPKWINKNSKHWTFLVGIEEWLQGQDHRQLVEFCENAGFHFVLKAEGQKDIEINAKGYPGSTSQGSGEFQAFFAKLNDSQFDQMVPGVAYKLEPLNKSDEYFWTVNDGVTLTKAADDALTYSVAFEITNQQFLQGDSIQITEILGSTDQIETGQTYTIKGKYELSSHDRAVLKIYATDGETHSKQGPVVDKGTGEFTRTFTYLKEGWLHLSFYPAEGGSSFGNLYFAQKGSNQKPLNISNVTSVVRTPDNQSKQSMVTNKEAIANKIRILQEQRERLEGDLEDAEKALDAVRETTGFTDLEEHSYPHPITTRLTRLQKEQDDCLLEVNQLNEKIQMLHQKHKDNPNGKGIHEQLKKAEDDLVVLQRKYEQLEQMVRETEAQKKELDLARSVYQRRVNIRDGIRERLNEIKSQIEKYKIMYEEADSPALQKDENAAKMLTIQVIEEGEEKPEVVLLKIPSAILDIRNTQIPEKAKQQMDKHGITLEKIVEMFKNNVKPMVLLEVEEENSQVSIRLE